MSDQEFMSEEQVANILNIDIRTLQNRRYARKNHPPFIKVGDTVLYRRTAFIQWMKEREKHQENRRAS